MRHVRVINRTRGKVLAESAELADNYWTRFKGLMGRRELPASSGLVLKPGGGIHMWFMRIPLDVLHVDEKESDAVKCSTITCGCTRRHVESP